MDGDTTFPTICGTGTEDYFCGSYNFENQETKQYQVFSTPYTGFTRSSNRTGSTSRSNASACIAGTFAIRSASSRICA